MGDTMVRVVPSQLFIEFALLVPESQRSMNPILFLQPRQSSSKSALGGFGLGNVAAFSGIPPLEREPQEITAS